MAAAQTPFTAFFFGFVIVPILGAAMARLFARPKVTLGHLLAGATLAIGVYSLLMTIVGFAGALRYSFSITVGLFLVGAVFCIVFGARHAGGLRSRVDSSSWRPADIPTWIAFWLLVVFEAGMLLNALAPYINQDAELSHYLFIRDYIASGHIHVFPENAFSYYPQALELGVLTAFSRAGERGPEAGNICFWFMQLLLVFWLIDFGCRRRNPRVGYFLALGACGLAYWPVIAYSGYVDGGVALFLLAGTFSYLDWLEPARPQGVPDAPNRVSRCAFTQLALAGFFLGTACASKYSALPFVALVFLHLVVIVIGERTHRREKLVAAAGFIVFLLIPMLPWYGRNLLLTGNPFFPFLRGMFGGPELTLADDVNTWATWGIAISLRNYLLYPFKLAWFFQAGENPWLRFPYMYMSWLFALVPVAGLLLLHRRIARIVAVWCFLFFTFAFFVMNLQTRYFIPATILGLWLVVEWLESLSNLSLRTDEPLASHRRSQKLTPFLKWVFLLVMLVPFGIQLGLVKAHFLERWPYIAGDESRAQFIERTWPSARVFEQANRLGSESDKVMIFSLRTYNLTAPYVIPSGENFDPDLTPDAMAASLRDAGVGYLLMESRVRLGATILEWCLENEEDAQGFTVFYDAQLADAMRDRNVSAGLAREILKHRGGARFQDDAGAWKWRINLSKFRSPDIAGILEFLAALGGLCEEGLVREEISATDTDPVRRDDWELYSILQPASNGESEESSPQESF